MSNYKSNLTSAADPILKLIAKYKNHQSILRIKNYMKYKDLSLFEFIDKMRISKEINNSDKRKAYQENGIPVKLVKSKRDVFSYFIYHNFNNSMSRCNFSSNLKAADILPNIKRDES